MIKKPKQTQTNPPTTIWIVPSNSGRLMDPSGTWSSYGKGKEEHKDWLSHVLLSLSTAGNTGQWQGTTAQQEGARPKGLLTSILVKGVRIFYEQYQQSPHLTFQSRTWQGSHMQESCTNATLWDKIKINRKKEYFWELHISVGHVVTSAFWCSGIEVYLQVQCFLKSYSLPLIGSMWGVHK